MANTITDYRTVELDTVTDGLLDGVSVGTLRGLSEESRELLALSLLVALHAPDGGISSIRIIILDGPGGGNPVVEYGGTKDALNAFMWDAFFKDDPELFNDFKIV